VVLGSGGSERIRSAITQVVAALVLDDLSLIEAVRAPRLHPSGGTVQLEPGFDPEAVATLRSVRDVNAWTTTDLYFGGVHAVDTAGAHIGDPRRGGVSARTSSVRPHDRDEGRKDPSGTVERTTGTAEGRTDEEGSP
jgi:gamma-glutamyltranspeptidase/glutathione hydrolase